MEGRPWSFENKLLVLQEIEKDVQPSDMVLNFSPFWIRLYNLPFGYRSDDRIKALARSLGQCMEIEEDFLNINPYRRIRVLVDISKPLKRFQLIRVKGNNTVKVTLKYERLPHFCFLCGLMSHTEKDCTVVSEEDRETGQGWGMDIRASPRKGFGKNREEIETLKLRKCLFVPKPQNTSNVAAAKLKGIYGLHEVGVENAVINVSEKEDSTSVPGQSTHMVTNEDKKAHALVTQIPTKENNLMADVDFVGTKEVAVVQCSNPDNSSSADLTVFERELNVAGAEVTCNLFHVGKSVVPSRKFIKAKKCSSRAKKPLSENVVSCSTLMVVPAQQLGSDHGSKRKMEDADVVMEEYDGGLKRSCGDISLSVQLNEDKVAGVGYDQPREQQ